MAKMITIYGYSCIPMFRRYADNNRIAIVLRTPEGEPVATATVNQPAVNLESDQVLIKDDAENQGILAALVKAGIVEDTGESVPVGHTEARLCRLLVKPTVH